MHGWCSVEKGETIFDITIKSKPGTAVLIGVWGGRDAICIALALKELNHGRLIAIDPWSATESEKGQTEPMSARWWSEQNHDDVYESFLWHLKRHNVADCVTVRRATSDKVELPPEIGLLIIDGNHGEQALADAKRFAPNVTLGGYCLLDDLDWTGGYVRQAEEFIKSIGFSFVRTIEGQTGLYQRIEMATPQDLMTTDSRQIPDEPARLTVCYITARREPMFQWFFDSLANQLGQHDKLKVIIVDLLAESRYQEAYELNGLDVKWVEPKPTIWQGKHRVTKEDWWAASNARNTGICLCDTEWIAFCDDRCVLLPSWLGAVKKAMAENTIIVGSYEKRSSMVVERGFIKGFDKLIGADPRLKSHPQGMKNCPHSWFFGCASAMPLETALAVNGYEEGVDGMGSEDSIFGLMLRNNGYSMTFDPQMRMIEDRTEGEISSGHGIDEVMKRADKGVSPNDKSHAALKRFGVRKTTEFTTDLREQRKKYLEVGTFWRLNPEFKTIKDWYDGQPICEF